MLHAFQKLLFKTYTTKPSEMLRSLAHPTFPCSYSYNPTPNTHPHLITSVNTPILPLPRQHLKYPRRQFIPNQPRKNHQILSLLQQRIRNRPRLRIVKRPA